MTASDAAELARVRDAAARLAADCSAILRKRALRCDAARFALARNFVKLGHREVVMAFASEEDIALARDGAQRPLGA